MNPRSKKYYENRQAQKGDQKGSSTIAGYNEQNQKNLKEPKENPGLSKMGDQPKVATIAEQDDTAGPNNSGERSDEN